jgi:hypothetical protein
MTSGMELGVARLMDETRESPGFSVIGGYERRLALNHHELMRESKPLFTVGLERPYVGGFFTDPFKYGEEVVGIGLMAVMVTGPMT